MRRVCLASCVVAGLFAIGCGPADVAGNYTVSVTNGPDRCATGSWTEGDSSSGIPVVITQDGDQITIFVEGPTGTLLSLGVGDNQFDGQVSGSSITAALVGDVTQRQDMCVYTYTVDMRGTIDGDLLEGTLTWRPVTNGHADCGALDTCEGNVQNFNGTRPPSGG